MNRASTGFKLMKEVKKQLKKEENRRARVLKQAKTLQLRVEPVAVTLPTLCTLLTVILPLPTTPPTKLVPVTFVFNT